MEKLDSIIFYSIDRAIKTYRQFAQNELRKRQLDITIDQWLILKAIIEHPEYSQHEIAELVFKDTASLTRMVELMVKKEYILRTISENDRRRFSLVITEKGQRIIQEIDEIVPVNRSIALNGINQKELEIVQKVMNTITKNTFREK